MLFFIIRHHTLLSEWAISEHMVGGRNMDNRHGKISYTSDQPFIQPFITFDFQDFLFRNLKTENVVIAGVNTGCKKNVVVFKTLLWDTYILP